MNKEEKLNLNAGDYAIRHCIIDQTYNGLEVHKMLCDAYIAGNNDTLDDEDERIRKELLEHCKNQAEPYIQTGNKCPQIQSWIAWLEKQGEQKTITFNNAHIIDPALNDYCCKQYDALHKENGGVLSFARLQHLAMDIYGWCNEYLQGEQEPKENKGNIEGISANWSEEDEIRLNTIIHNITIDKSMCKYEVGKSICDEQINWLKSIKDRVQPQNHWKPSEGDIIILEKLINGELEPKVFQATLQGILEQLKKL